MITFRQKGDFSKLTSYLGKLKKGVNLSSLDKYGQEGVAALESTTPKDSGLTAKSWYYKVAHNDRSVKLYFCNSNINNGVMIAIVIQYGHATGNGGWVEGRDYINPALQPLFDKMAEKIWREVTSL